MYNITCCEHFYSHYYCSLAIALYMYMKYPPSSSRFRAWCTLFTSNFKFKWFVNDLCFYLEVWFIKLYIKAIENKTACSFPWLPFKNWKNLFLQYTCRYVTVLLIELPNCIENSIFTIKSFVCFLSSFWENFKGIKSLSKGQAYARNWLLKGKPLFVVVVQM